MAVKGYQSRVLVDGFDLSSVTGGATFATDTSAIEYSNFQSAAVNKIAGDPAATLEHRGRFVSGAAGTLEKVMKDRLGTTDTVYTTAIFGTSETVPASFTFDQAYAGQLTFEMPVDNLIAISGNWQQMTQVIAGRLLYAGTISATGAGTVVDMGAGGTAGGVAFVHITAVVGTATSATIQIQSATALAFGSPNLRGTATFSGTSSTGLQCVRVSLGSGTVDRYMRINTNSLGGATSFTVAVVAGVSGVTY